MASLTVANYLGQLRDDPDDASAFQGLAEALSSGDAAIVGEQPLRLLEAARHGHERRGELQAVAWLIRLETSLTEDDPGFQAVLYKELGRLCHEELLDPEGAVAAYRNALELQPEDEEVEMALEEIEQASEKWRPIADRFIEEASDASDAGLKASMLTRAAMLVWQHQGKGRTKEVDKLFREALKADPAATRAARLYCVILKEREKFKDVAKVLSRTADAARGRDDKLNLYIQAGRVFLKQLEDPDSAATCYQRALDFAPGHEEALRFLVEYFTERERWEELVALYEEALRSRQQLESEQGILLQIGMVHWRIRNSADEAEPFFARLRKIDPAHPGMLNFYGEFLKAKAESEDQDVAQEAKSRHLTILGDALRVAESPEQKAELGVQLARTAQGAGATERAIDAWKAVQRLDPSHEEASRALRELYKRGEKWNALVEVMKAELDALPAASDDPETRERRVRLLRELIAIYRDQLHLDVMVINSYNALLEEEPGDREALGELARTYEQMGRYNDLIQVLGLQVEAEEDAGVQVEILMRIARLWIDRFANYNQATKPLEAIIEIEPEHRSALSELKTIYTKKRAWKSLFDVLAREVQLASDPSARLELKVELARLAGDRLHKHSEAIALWKEVVAEEPDSPEALDSLVKLADKEKDWESLAAALELQLERTDEERRRIKTLQKLGTTYGEHLKDPGRAAGAWKRVLEIDPRNGRALRTLRESFAAARDWEGLEALYAENEDWDGLVDVLGTAAERAEDPELKKELSFRAAAIYEERIGNPERAFRSYERVLSVDPNDVRAARALIPIYREQEKWSRLVGLHEVLLENLPEDAPLEERLELLGELRELSATRTRDDHGAFRWAAKAYELAPEDNAVRKAVEEAAAKASAHEKLAELYRARLEQDVSGSEKTALRRKLASLAGEKLGKSDDAIAQLQQILETDPRDAEAVQALDRLYRQEDRKDDLRRLYIHRLEHSEDTAERYALLSDLAELEEYVLGDPESAAERFRAMLEIEPSDAGALEALDRLAVDNERWGELADVLARRAELADADDRVGLIIRLGDVRRTKLDDLRGALDAYADVVAADATHQAAISGIETIAADEELHAEAYRHLEAAYEATERYEDLARVLKDRLEATEDADTKRELQLRIAELSATALGDPEGAYAALESAFLDSPAEPELWDRLGMAAEGAGKHEELAAAFDMAIEAGALSEDDVAALSERVAEIYDIILATPEKAEKHHKRVLHHDPLHERAFFSLKELYTNKERWDDLQVLYRNRIAETLDGEAKLELLLQVCFLFEEILDNAELAIRSYQEVLELQPDHTPSRRALDRLYRRTERWRDLVALLRQDLDREEDEHRRLELTYEIGELHEKNLGEASAAVDQYEQVLDTNPTHLKAQQSLERLIDDAEQRQRIAAILEPLYEAQGAFQDLAKILEIQLEAITDPAGQVALLTRLGELYESHIHDLDKAFEAFSRAVLADPEDLPAREQLKRLAGMRGASLERAEILEKALAASEGKAHLESELLLEIARVYDDEIQDTERAERAYERLLEVDADNPDAVLPAARALERIHLAKGNHEKLARDYRLQIKTEFDAERRGELLVRLATLLEEELEDVPGAIAAHRERLDIDPSSRDALRSLERLYERQGEWQRLIGILQALDGAVDDDEDRRIIGRRIGEIYEEKQDDVENAIGAYNDVLSRFGPDDHTLEALARLYRKGERPDDLLEVLEMQLLRAEESGADADTLAGLHFEMAEVMRKHTRDIERAIDTYQRILEVSPGHPPTINALEEVITDPDSDERVAAARVLVPVYEGQSAFDELVGALDVLAGSDDPVERLRSLRRAAEVADIGRNDQAQAFRLLAKAIEDALGEPDLPRMLEELARLGEAAEKHAEQVDLLEKIAPDVFDGELQTEVLMRAASLARTPLEQVERARRLYQRVLEVRPDHQEALDSLDALQAGAGDFDALLETLRRKTELAETPAERVELLERRARICETQMDDMPGAIDAMEQVLVEDPGRAEAYDKLGALYEKSERWPDLASTLERQLDAGAGHAVDVRYRLGSVAIERLNDAYQALDQFREALAMDPGHEPTIAALQKLMESADHRGAAAEILEPVFLQRMDWPNVTATLEARLTATDDPHGRKEILRRLGQIHEDYLEDLEGAMACYARLLQEDVRDRDTQDTLSRLGKVLEEWEQLAGIFGGAVEKEGVLDEEMAELSMETGRLYQEMAGNAEAAVPFYERVLELDPTQRRAFDQLRVCLEGLGRSEDLLGLLRRRVDVADSDEERVLLLHQVAHLEETTREDVDAAIAAHRDALLIDPSDLTATEALDRLFTQTERWDDLADHLRARIDQSIGLPEEAELKHRLGQLLLTKQNDTVGAIDTFESVLQGRPDHQPSIQALEGLVMDADHQQRITEILEPIYRGADEWKKLVAVLEARAGQSDDPYEIRTTLSEVGRLHEERGQDLSLAFTAWARAFAAEPFEEEPRSNVDRLAGLLDSWNEHVAAYESALRKAEDPALKTQLLSMVARVHDEKRGDPRSAIETYERLVEHDPDDNSALDALEALQTMVGDWKGLAAVLSTKVERTYDPIERAELLRRSASVLEELLGDTAAAVETYQRAAQEDPDDPIALESLDRLYAAASDSERLAEILTRRIDVEDDEDLKVEVGMRLGQLANTQLNRPQDAIDAYLRVLEIRPSYPDAVEALGALYERQAMWPELLDNLELRAGMAESSEQRVGFLHRAGAIHERELDDVYEALAKYSQALEIENRHEPSLQAVIRVSHLEDYRSQAAEILEPLLHVQERWNDLADLHRLKADAATDPFDKKAELRKLAEVHEHGRHDDTAAFKALAQAFGEDPSDQELAANLERLAEKTGLWGELADTLESRASNSFDPENARQLYGRLARICEEQLNDPARAVSATQRALEQVGDDPDLLRHLDELLVATERWHELGDVLERRGNLVDDPTERAGLLVRLGELREQHQGDLRGAFAAYQEVVERDPGDARATEALERLGRHPEMALEVVDVLEQAYRETGAMDKIAGLYDIRIELADSDGERVRMLQEAAQLWETDLGQPEKALESLRKAFLVDPRDLVLLDDIDRLAAQTGAWETLRGMVEQVVDDGGIDRMLRRDLELRAARWYRDRLGDLESAEARLRGAVQADPDAVEAHAELSELLRALDGREAELVTALRKWAEIEMDEEARKGRLREAAAISESVLGDTAQAAQCLLSILESDPTEPEALAELTRIRQAQEQWGEVVVLLERRIEATFEVDERIGLRRQLAHVLANQLEDTRRATEAWEGLLEEAPESAEAMDALQGLYESAERWDDLRMLLDRRLEMAETDEARIVARVGLARLAEKAFGRRDDAMDQLQGILEIDPHNGEALDEMERLLGLEERWEDVVQLLENRIAQSGEPKPILLRLAEIHEAEREDLDQAVETLERILSVDAGDVAALERLIGIHESREQWAQAVHGLERLVALQDPHAAAATERRVAQLAEEKLGEPERALGALQRSYDLEPSATTHELLKEHYNRHERWGELAVMIQAEADAEEDDDAKVELLKKVAELYQEKLDDPGSAATALEQASAMRGEDREILLPLCDLYIAAGRQQDAVPVLEKIIESFGGRRSKELASYHHLLGKAMEGMGNSEGALEHYDAAFKIDLTNVAVLRDLGKLTHATGDYARAQKTFRALLLQKLDAKAGITKADVYFYLGDLAHKDGDQRKAISMLERAVTEEKGHEQATALLAELKPG
ncbi:MAG: tetratricopeptide repeat protein [Deltaproteobacteria bacterium]|nr:tetratricopeptide repeat protein [Deltaproteobacteria bacterium]